MIFLLQKTLIYTIPLLIVALAGMFAERSGIINIALDGIMIFGVFQCVLLGILLILLMQEKLRRVGKVAIMPLFAMVLYCIGVTLL